MKRLLSLALFAWAATAMAQWDLQAGIGDTRLSHDANGTYFKTIIIVINNGPQSSPRYQVTLNVTRADGSPVCGTGYAVLPPLAKNTHSEPVEFDVAYPPGSFKAVNQVVKTFHEKWNLTAIVQPYGADPSGDTNVRNNTVFKTIETAGIAKGKPSCKRLMGEQ
jgi:hypothetical protein